MSVFSVIRRGRQAAKEHHAKQAEKEKNEQESAASYRHVPKHAAIDALAGGPSIWREADRYKIREQNKRRSAMAAAGVGISDVMTPARPAVPRVNSSLSHVSYPAVYASPVVQVPRSYSYNSIQPSWNGMVGDATYRHAAASRGSGKGKHVERAMIDSGCVSASSSKGSETSPVESSGNSTSSQDGLEMGPTNETLAPATDSTTDATPRTIISTGPRTGTKADYARSLHYSHSRRPSDSSALYQRRDELPEVDRPNMPPAQGATPPMAKDPKRLSKSIISRLTRNRHPSERDGKPAVAAS